MAPEALEVRRGWRIVGLTIRAVLLIVLIFGVLITVLNRAPLPETRAEFRAAAAADRISLVEYDEQDGAIRYVRWAEGPLTWRELDAETFGAAPPPYTMADLKSDMGRSGAKVTELSDSGEIRLGPQWVLEMPAPVGGDWLLAAWVLTFLIMLGSTPRLGNRWAWFWILGAGWIGAILFLLLEPRPFWFEAGRTPAPRGRLGGGRGFLLGILLALLSTALTLAVGYLLNLVLS
ncbi:hypothetical protein [Streptosporangium sp. NBC_01469]|uniref:hypothetical protein n=1 Tax=Streptosporangium sp. NBC_01469 TaxID=2903898 RepID=UPI002E2CBAEC|nr:hypothetical protein [Streptosporangium sp. NBC_01469]